jgi:hypothetical protein
MSIADTSLSLGIDYHHSSYLVCFAFYSLLYSKQSLIEFDFNYITMSLAISVDTERGVNQYQVQF